MKSSGLAEATSLPVSAKTAQSLQICGLRAAGSQITMGGSTRIEIVASGTELELYRIAR
jgi:hypothetical protein